MYPVPVRRLAGPLLGIMLLALPGMVPAQAADEDILANVNRTAITAGDLDLMLDDLAGQLNGLTETQQRAAALSFLIEVRLLAEAAAEAGLDETPEFQRRMELLRQRTLHSSFVEAEVAAALTDEKLRERYDRELAGATPVNEVRARHILLPTQEEAEAVIAELDQGGDFAALAIEKSTDPGRSDGGDLGFFGPGQMVKPFEEAAFALEVGSYTREPVQTQFGWHVIKVEDRRAQQPPAFEEVKEQIRSVLFRDAYGAVVEKARAAAQIEVMDEKLQQGLEEIGR